MHRLSYRLGRIYLAIKNALIYLFVEKKQGVDFARMRRPYSANSDSLWYETITSGQIESILDGYVREEARLLDVGCGKGYFIFCAKEAGFRYVDGVEKDGDLYRIAKRNMRKLEMKDVRLFHEDATLFRGLDDYDVLYVFNPFRMLPMHQFARHARESLKRRPRPLTVIYAHPMQHEQWDALGEFWLRETRTVKRFPRNITVYYYESKQEQVKGAKTGGKFKHALDTCMGNRDAVYRPAGKR